MKTRATFRTSLFSSPLTSKKLDSIIFHNDCCSPLMWFIYFFLTPCNIHWLPGEEYSFPSHCCQAWACNLLGALIGSGCHNKIPQTGRLKHQKCIFSQFKRLEIKDQGVSRFGFWWDFFWLADSCLFAMSTYGLSSMCVCIFGLSSCKDTSHSGLEPPHLWQLTLIKEEEEKGRRPFVTNK